MVVKNVLDAGEVWGKVDNSSLPLGVARSASWWFVMSASCISQALALKETSALELIFGARDGLLAELSGILCLVAR